MARKPSTKVVLNRAALDTLHLALAEGIEEVCRTIVETADPPDATPHGEGLVTRGGWLVYKDNKKIGGGSLDGTQPAKPRAFRPSDGISGIVGFGFPARFQETGTVNQPARPFLTPAVEQVWGESDEIIRSAVRARMR